MDEIETLKRRIERLENALEIEKRKERELSLEINDLIRSFKTSPADKWYLFYLMEQLRRQEVVHEQNLEALEAYQQDHAKYGKFYHYCKLMHKDEIEKAT